MKAIQPVLVFTLVFTVAFFSSCKKIKEVLQVDFDYEAEPITVTIPAVPIAGQGFELSKGITMDLDAIIRENAPVGSTHNVREINLTGITIEVAGADEDNNLQNLETIRMTVGADGLDDKVIAEVASNPDTYETLLSLPIPGGSADLKPYIMNKKFDYTLYVKPRRGTTKSLTVTVKSSYTFVVGV